MPTGRCYHPAVHNLLQAALGRRLIIYTGAWATGIALADRLGGSPIAWLAAAACLGACALLLRHRCLAGLAATALLALALGGARFAQASALSPGLAAGLGRSVRVVGVVAGPTSPTREGESVRFDLAARRIAGRPAGERLLAVVPEGFALRIGERLALVGQLSAPPPMTNPAQIGVPGDYPAILRVGDARLVTRLGRERPGVPGLIDTVRRRAATALLESMPGPYREQMSGLLGSVIMGTGAFPMATEIGDLMRRAGIIHIAVVSGSQITLLFLVIYSLGQWRRRAGTMVPPPSLPLVVLAAGLVVALIIVTGGGEPTWRAGVMGLVTAAGCLLWHLRQVSERHPLQGDVYCSLALTALVLLIVNPRSLYVPGAQLSFAAVWGLVYLAPRLALLLPDSRVWGWAATVSLAPQLAVAPVLSWHFGTLPLGGFLTNVIAVPLAGVLLFTGMATMLLGSLYLPLALPLGWANVAMLELLLRSAAWVANLPAAGVTCLVRSPVVVAAYYLALGLAAYALAQGHLRRQQAHSLRIPAAARP